MKFKVGDHIKINDIYPDESFLGKEGFITCVPFSDSLGTYLVEVEGRPGYIFIAEDMDIVS